MEDIDLSSLERDELRLLTQRASRIAFELGFAGVFYHSRYGDAGDGFEMEGSETLYLQNHAQVDIVGGAQLNGQTPWVSLSNSQVQPASSRRDVDLSPKPVTSPCPEVDDKGIELM